jgi:hypothetical protein
MRRDRDREEREKGEEEVMRSEIADDLNEFWAVNSLEQGLLVQ